MIIMINGAFGVGKTSVANELQKTINNSMIFDPEEIGYMLRNIITEDIAYPSETTNYGRFSWSMLPVI
jgi:2-phosphoglycerate kinase